MAEFTVTLDGETHKVSESAIGFPEGHKLLKPNAVPDGFVPQETMDKTIARRVQNAKQNARQAALEEVPNSISDEELKKFKAFKEINEDPEKLEEIIQNAESDTEELNKLKSEKRNREVAEVQGWNAKVLNDLSKDDVEYEIKDGTDDEGNDIKYAVLKDSEGNETKLSEYADEHWGHMKPALEATDSGDSKTKEEQKGKRFTSQSPASNGKANKGGALQKAIKQNHKAAGIKDDDE